MPSEFSSLWTPRAIKQECGRSHREYKKGLEGHYEAYFGDRPDLAGEHRFKARDLGAALPPGYKELGKLVPRNAWHVHHLSGGSSQVLAVALLASAIQADPRLSWLSGQLELQQPFKSDAPKATFEFALQPTTLNEEPYVTNVDLLVEDEAVLVCVEAKLWEEGLGSCRCGKEKSEAAGDDEEAPEQEPTPAQERAACSCRILKRPAYWSAARDVLGLPERVEGQPCPIAAYYQTVRNVAAARALADGRRAVFALIYDERNPYFSPCGRWPGWPAALDGMIADQSAVSFRACSWQRLLASGAVPRDVVSWAADKHGLSGSAAT